MLRDRRSSRVERRRPRSKGWGTPQADGGFFVECPSLPGCLSQGDTRDDALGNTREAMLPALEDLEEMAELIPETLPPIVTEVSINR